MIAMDECALVLVVFLLENNVEVEEEKGGTPLETIGENDVGEDCVAVLELKLSNVVLNASVCEVLMISEADISKSFEVSCTVEKTLVLSTKLEVPITVVTEVGESVVTEDVVEYSETVK